MKVVLLENLLISGKRYTAGEESEVDETVGLQLLKDNLALVGVNEVENDPVEEAPLPTPEAAFAPIPEAQDEPEPEVKQPVKRRVTKKVEG
jgi:hypothetical protein|nr:MAG TPA: hypothetical protein [Caudoviricetes sp.]DAJ29674.1 MAG TPA: hypothetical protein [Caudoviricetes sp.]